MSDATTPPTRSSGPSRSGTTYMVVGTLVAAIAAYLFQLIGARALGPDAFAPIAVLWTVQFLVFTTVFMPMEQLTIRRLNASETRAAPWSLFLGLIAASAVGAVLYGFATLDRSFDGNVWYLLILAVLIVAYGGFAIGRGFLAGRLRYREYGLSTLAESMLRLLLAVGLLAAGFGALGLSWTLVAGALVIWLWSPLRGERRREQGIARETGSTGTLATFISANAAAQTIVAAGPLVVGALGAAKAEVSIFFETFLLYRAPLTVSYSLIARVLPPFTRMVDRGEIGMLKRWAARITASGLVLATAAFLVGAVIGDDLVAVLLGEQYRPTPELAAMAVAGVTLATVALFEQQLLIAMRCTRQMAAAWAAALVIAALVVLPDGAEASIRVGRAFLAGEIAALLGLTAAILRRPA